MTDKPENTADYSAPGRRFFGRRKGPSLSDRKTGLMEDVLPRISVTIPEDKNDSISLGTLFGGAKSEIWLEIGFGKGEHLAWQAQANPDIGLIGCEPYMNGVAGLVTQVDEQEIKNIRIYADDARHVIWQLPDASVDRVFLIHPDPWPKKRHAPRRFVNPENLDDIARILKDNGEFRVGTDHPIYREWTAIQMSERDDFCWLADGPDDWLVRPDDWPETRYEVKALEGHSTYFRFKRLLR